jgi:CDP-glycerol glycerophosphotransferase (TagB/SpsB family)
MWASQKNGDWDADDLSEQKQRLGLPADKKIILIVTQPAICIDSLTRVRGNVPIIQSVIDELSSINGLFLVIKIHPGEKISDYRNLRFEEGRAVVNRDGSIMDYLESCDAMIVGDSSIAIDAMMKGKPVIYLNMEGGDDLVPYPEYGAMAIYDRAGIRPAVDKALYREIKPYSHDRLKSMVYCEGKEAVLNAFLAISSFNKKNEKTY